MSLKSQNQCATMFADLQKAASDGRITDAFVVVRGRDGTYDDMYYCDDLAEMLLEVGSAKIRGRLTLAAQDKAQ
jgi:hypothetical protein